MMGAPQQEKLLFILESPKNTPCYEEYPEEMERLRKIKQAAHLLNKDMP